MAQPLVVIFGRQNVGKSTLFNRIARRRVSIVKDEPGVTRDRIYVDVEWEDKKFSLMDTGGFITGDSDSLIEQVKHHALYGVDEADIIIYLMDGRSGLTPTDMELSKLIRSYNKEVLWVVNKIDGPVNEKLLYDFYSIGEKVIPVSAEHGVNFDAMMDEVVSRLKPYTDSEDLENIPKIAIVGRPNVGKSTLLNSLVGKDRMIVSSQAGTTRDSVDSVCTYYGKNYLLIDTAGIRKKPKVLKGIESYSVGRAIRAIERCDAAFLLLDASQGIVEQDKKILHLIHSAHKGLVILINKWDVVEEDHEQTYKNFMRAIEYQMWGSANYAHVITTSGLTRKRVTKVFPIVDDILEARNTRISTGPLNKIVAQLNDTLPVHKGRPVKVFYTTQVSNNPPSFTIFVNQPDGVKDNHVRYAEKLIRNQYSFKGTPIRIFVKKK